MTARWHILGVGAIGGLFACRLQSGGADVTLLSRAREEPARELVLKHTISERFHFPQQTITPNEDPIEHLLVCTKAWAVESAIKAVAHRLSATSVVVLLCNGMGIAEAVAPLIGEAQLVVGSTTSGCRRSSEGELIVSGDGRTQLGMLDSSPAPTWLSPWR
ncbi:MAG: ketopantoate reductase family protein, partial [Luminiphilus sp.]